QYKAGEKYADYGMPNAVNGAMEVKTTDLIRQLWLDNGYYGDVFSLNYNKTGTVVTLGGAVTRYNGDHYGRVTWAQNGLTEAKRWYDLTATKSDANVYAKWQQNLSTSIQLYTDLQWRGINYKLNGFRNNPSLSLTNRYNFFNPKIGLSYLKNEWSGYASYGIGNKEPNRDDFETAAGQQPKAERLQDVELGFQQKNKQFNWGATLYHMKYKDQLVLTGKLNDVGAYTRTNVDNSYRQGIELQAGMRIASWLQASGNLAFSKNRLKNFNEYIDDYDLGIQKINTYRETDISFSPAVVSAVTFTVSPLEKLEIAFMSKFVSKQYLDNTSNDNRSLAAYFTQNVGVGYSFSRRGLKNVGLSLNLINVFNTFYEPNGYTFSYYNNSRLTTENYYFPMAGFNAVIGVNVRL
ncbi:MAG: TonB-dependent receptor, partial [Chitinophagaceae bacterium]